MTTAKVFMNGRSQAIRLPKAFRVSSSEVYLKRVSGGILILERDPWETFEHGVRKFSASFFEAMAKRKRLPQQRRDWKGVFA
ncbi:MAG: AbrB/MazE/SpoVT family DNA-binding domain-containing protein [Verrucomicrobia bacterium]|nr:AbrB/MazE/SpoVT family DNA-binding domain-containing protein [Verrucomicrobiota bacterium]